MEFGLGIINRTHFDYYLQTNALSHGLTPRDIWRRYIGGERDSFNIGCRRYSSLVLDRYFKIVLQL